MSSAYQEQIAGSHYKDFEIQPSEFIYKNKLNWFEANAIKYTCRHKMKNGADDLKKAIHYLRLLLEEKYKITSEVTYEETP